MFPFFRFYGFKKKKALYPQSEIKCILVKMVPTRGLEPPTY